MYLSVIFFKWTPTPPQWTYSAKTLLVIVVLFLSLSSCAPRVKTQEGSEALWEFTLEAVPQDARWIVAVPDFSVRTGSVTLPHNARQTEQDAASPLFYQQLGSGMADIFVNEVFRSQQFRITERAEIDKIIGEQTLATSGLLDSSTAASVGRILGAELIVLGSLTEFWVDRSVQSGALFGVLGGSTEQITSRATVDIRFVNSSTAEIVAIGHASSEVTQNNVQLDVLNIIRALQAGQSGNSVIDIAVRNAMIGAINDAARLIPHKDKSAETPRSLYY